MNNLIFNNNSRVLSVKSDHNIYRKKVPDNWKSIKDYLEIYESINNILFYYINSIIFFIT